MSGGRLAVLVPYRDRQRYLDVFARAVPDYLERVNGIRDYAIYVAEQESDDLYNLALGRDVAALAALADGGFDYFVFHDVDIIPVADIDYGPRAFNVAWFLSAGSCKVRVADFVRANGYNPDFVGWGDEDVEFYHRLGTVGSEVREWHRCDESRAAVAINLDWPELTDAESLRWSRSYFGHSGAGPRFVTWDRVGSGRAVEPYDKTAGFLREPQRLRNQALWGRLHRLPRADMRAYLGANGLNRVSLERTRREQRGPFRWIRYRTDDVLARAADAGAGESVAALAPEPASPLARCAERLAAAGRAVCCVQIGAMDGVRFDPIHDLVERFGWRGLLVEPLPDAFAALRETYREQPGLAFDDVAIADSDGTRRMYRIRPETIAARDLPDWAIGLASLYRDKNALGWPELAPHVVEEPVRCTTLPALLRRHEVARIDVLQIDAGGADFMILRQLDFERWRPALIHLEVCNLTPAELEACHALLGARGYRVGPGDGSNDLLAVDAADVDVGALSS